MAFLIGWLLRRSMHHIGRMPTPESVRIMLHSARGPLLLLLWGYGTVFALVPLVPRIDGAVRLLPWLWHAADAVALIAVFWLLLGAARRGALYDG